MDPATPNGETGTPKAPENVTPAPAPAPAGNASDPAVEQLRKEKEQAEMRANQLANQLKAKEEAEAAAEAERLAKQNEFKTLFEQEKAKREALESEREADERRKELEKAKAETSKDFSDEVKAEAEELGIVLNSTDEADVAAFKEKLERIQKRVGTSSKVTPNNPGVSSGNPELSTEELRMALKDPAKFAEIAAKKPGIAAMMSPQRR